AYVLTSGTTLIIEQLAATPEFTVTSAGNYTIHTLVAELSDSNDPNYLDTSVINFGVTTGGDVLNLVTSIGLCAALDVTGAAVVVEDELSVPENSLQDISVYPNPVTNFMTLNNSKRLLINSITVYDLSGRDIKTFLDAGTNQNYQIDLSELSSGSYIMLITTNSGKLTKQILKK
ncbi:T9SS type A sorting domain-containing protein, partial [Bizionia sediminis]